MVIFVGGRDFVFLPIALSTDGDLHKLAN